MNQTWTHTETSLAKPDHSKPMRGWGMLRMPKKRKQPAVRNFRKPEQTLMVDGVAYAAIDLEQDQRNTRCLSKWALRHRVRCAIARTGSCTWADLQQPRGTMQEVA